LKLAGSSMASLARSVLVSATSATLIFGRKTICGAAAARVEPLEL